MAKSAALLIHTAAYCCVLLLSAARAHRCKNAAAGDSCTCSGILQSLIQRREGGSEAALEGHGRRIRHQAW